MFLLPILFLISSAVEMSQATTPREFRQCFPQWVNADQVNVSCNNTVSVLIAQYCSPDHQSCRNMSKPGVLLDEYGVCLTIINCSYDSWSCKAKSYTNSKEDEESFTVNVMCNYDWVLLLIIFGLIICGLIIGIYFLCTKVKRFRKAIGDFWSHLKCMNQDMAGKMEMGEMRVNGATGALGASAATGVGERKEMGETEKFLPHTQNNVIFL